MQSERILTAIDLGSAKTVALIARILPRQEIELLGLGVSPSKGIRAGAVTNIEQAAASIREAVDEAELMSAMEVDEAIINITGKHVRGDNSNGVVAVTNRDRVISPGDVYRVIDAARSVRIPGDQEILHVLSREFKVDDQTGIRDPLGMIGVRLESTVHIVTGSTTQIQNTEKAVHTAGVPVRDRILSSLASSAALLGDSEKDLGVAVVDIGAGITDIIIYTEGGVAFSGTLPIGGSHLTQDISIGLKTPMDAAETIKRRHGIVVAKLVDATEMIEVPAIGERPPRMIARRDLAEILEARMREILEMIDQELYKSGKKNMLAGGIVFTGGAALIDGLIPLAEEVVKLGASVGIPRGLTGITDKVSSPVFATAVGLIAHHARFNEMDTQKRSKGGFLGRIKTWVQDNL